MNKRFGRIFNAMLLISILTTLLITLLSWAEQIPQTSSKKPKLENLSSDVHYLPMIGSEPLDLDSVDSEVIKGLSKKISLDLRSMDIVDIIKFLGMKGNLNFVTSKNVGGKVTIFLNNVAIGDLLDVVLFTNNLACEIKRNIITIMTEAEYKALYGKIYNEKRELRVITLEYANAGTVLQTLSDVKSEIGRIIANEKTGTLILIDIPEKVKEMRDIVVKLDLPTIQRVVSTVKKVFEFSYATAKDIEPEISKYLTPELGTISINENANKIIVRDLPYKISRIEELVAEFDIKPKQVLIEVKILEVTLKDNSSVGVDWQKFFSHLDDLTFTGSFPFSAPSSTTSSFKVDVGTFASDKYNVVLEFVKSIGKTEIISTPRIAVCNRDEAKFMVGSREAYVTSTITTGDVSTTTSENVEFIEVGVTLHITPTINKDGFVKMHIKPEVSSVREWLETSEGNKVPIVDTSNVETDVLIKEGRTMLIAGLVKDIVTKNISKVPILGDIPLLGLLFRSKSNLIQKKEVIIFLTPYIISGEGKMADTQINKKPRKKFKETKVKELLKKSSQVLPAKENKLRKVFK